MDAAFDGSCMAPVFSRLIVPLCVIGCAVSDGPRLGRFPVQPALPGAAEQADLPTAQVESPTEMSEGAPAMGEAEVAVEEGMAPLLPLTQGQLWARWNALRGEPYALDGVERRLEKGGRPPCDPKSLVSYPGTAIRYHGALAVSEPFKERLARFEQVVAEVAREIYGREPRRIRHYGAYSCRHTRKRSWLVSEHALGNALDVTGFDFGPATKEQPLLEELPKQLRHSFQVRIAKHWSATQGTGEIHARFLARLTQRLEERDDIFRSMFGPGHGNHDDHLHLDVSPWRHVDF
jgi:hypothetical protein